jgi:hypothetical protein
MQDKIVLNSFFLSLMRVNGSFMELWRKYALLMEEKVDVRTDSNKLQLFS